MVIAKVNGRVVMTNGMPRVWSSLRAAKKSRYWQPWRPGDVVEFAEVTFVTGAVETYKAPRKGRRWERA